jgi:ABC-2 type transport system ATP-binding protein
MTVAEFARIRTCSEADRDSGEFRYTQMIVRTLSLTKRYGPVTALDRCDLEVRRGEVLGLLGPNGSGKTTLLRLLLGYLRPTYGEAKVDGLDCRRQSLEVRRRVAYLPGEMRMFPEMRCREVLRFFADVRRQQTFERSLKLAERLELDLSRRVSQLSTGMKRKLALAGTLAADTPLLILDEPTSNLDATVRGEVIALVREAQRAGRTVIFSSHVLSEIEQSCDRAVLLRKGRLVCEQVLADLRRQHRIRATLAGPLPAPPPDLAGQLAIAAGPNNHVTIETPGELAPLLSWLATLPLAEVQIEPFGLQAIYDRFHSAPLPSIRELSAAKGTVPSRSEDSTEGDSPRAA